ncbi:hypothetical protein [Ralstonia solanacearum]|uniref:hypothetical protein n=1 Tax=Ralstonia solanacearum TaxID=305 RepID=UPI000A57AAB2|nr:hypothetical protein [Ralstonia solanacearum]
MFDLKATIGRLAEGQTLGRQDAWKLFEHMAFGQASHAQLGALLMALRIRGRPSMKSSVPPWPCAPGWYR